LKNALFFDLDFGLGSLYPSGEEYIFLTDALKLGLNVGYFPVVIGIHPDSSSGDDFFSSPIKIQAKRQMFIRIFGKYSFPIIVMFWIKKLLLLPNISSFLRFSRYLLLK
jgi:hypothetical protein